VQGVRGEGRAHLSRDGRRVAMSTLARAERVLREIMATSHEERIQALVESPDLFDYVAVMLDENAALRGRLGEVETTAAFLDVECAALRRMAETVDARIGTLVDEECGMQPVTTPDALLTILERHMFERRLHIQSLELDNAGLVLAVMRLDEMRKEHDMRCAVCFEAKGNDRHVGGCEVGVIRGLANPSPTVRRPIPNEHDAE
jgi:hypothetical protein